MTGIKVVDLLAPYAKGGKIGLFGGAGVGKTVSRTRMNRLIALGVAYFQPLFFLVTESSQSFVLLCM